MNGFGSLLFWKLSIIGGWPGIALWILWTWFRKDDQRISGRPLEVCRTHSATVAAAVISHTFVCAALWDWAAVGQMLPILPKLAEAIGLAGAAPPPPGLLNLLTAFGSGLLAQMIVFRLFGEALARIAGGKNGGGT